MGGEPDTRLGLFPILLNTEFINEIDVGPLVYPCIHLRKGVVQRVDPDGAFESQVGGSFRGELNFETNYVTHGNGIFKPERIDGLPRSTHRRRDIFLEDKERVSVEIILLERSTRQLRN